MHLVFNSGTCGKSFGWCDFICKVTDKRIPASDKYRWAKGVDVFWKINHGWIVCLRDFMLGILLHIKMKCMLKEFGLSCFAIISLDTWILM